MTGEPPADDLLPFEDALAAVRRGAIEPAELPRRVAAAVTVAVCSAHGPAVADLVAWGTAPARGVAARQAAALGTALVELGSAPPDPGPVVERYGPAGVVAVVGVAALALAEDLDRPVPPLPAPLLPGVAVRLGHGLSGLARQMHRSFGEVPVRWRRMALQGSVIDRWWMLHEAALAPGALTGEEKWLVVASLADTLGDPELSALYQAFLIRQGWDPAIVVGAMAGAGARLRRGFRPLIVAARRAVVGGVDLPRLRLAGADLPAACTGEVVELMRLTRALLVLGALRDD